MTPVGNNLKYYKDGIKAYRDGKSIDDNPWLFSNRFLRNSTWWQKGFIDGEKKC